MEVVKIARMNPVGAHVANATLSSAVTIANTNSTGMIAQATGENIRYTLGGTTPTASLGFQMAAGDPPILIPTATPLKFIEETATATLQYQLVDGV